MKRTIVQISSSVHPGTETIGVVALASDGSLWWITTQVDDHWDRFPGLPDETEEETEGRLKSRRAMAKELSVKLDALTGRKGV